MSRHLENYLKFLENSVDNSLVPPECLLSLNHVIEVVIDDLSLQGW